MQPQDINKILTHSDFNRVKREKTKKNNSKNLVCDDLYDDNESPK